MREIVRPLFPGATLVSVKVERGGSGNSMGLVTARSSDGKVFWIALNAFDLEEGGAVPLFMLLQKCWQAPVVARLGRYPRDEKEFDLAYYEGIREAAPSLDRLGMKEIFGPKGVFMSWREIEMYYGQRLVAH